MVEDTWKNFEVSGKISDYLMYRKNTVGAGEESCAASIKLTENSAVSERGMGSYGTERGSDRNGAKCNADW